MPDCSNTCMQLPAVSLSSLLSQGWSVVSGPHNTQAECMARCCPSSSSSRTSSSARGSSFFLASSGTSSAVSSTAPTSSAAPSSAPASAGGGGEIIFDFAPHMGVWTQGCKQGVPESLMVSLSGGDCDAEINFRHSSAGIWLPVSETKLEACAKATYSVNFSFSLFCMGTTWTLALWDEKDLDLILINWEDGSYSCSPFELDMSKATYAEQNLVNSGCCKVDFTSILVTE